MEATSTLSQKIDHSSLIIKGVLTLVAMSGRVMLARRVDVQQVSRNAPTWISNLGTVGIIVLVTRIAKKALNARIAT